MQIQRILGYFWALFGLYQPPGPPFGSRAPLFTYPGSAPVMYVLPIWYLVSRWGLGPKVCMHHFGCGVNWIKGYYMIVKIKNETFWFSTYSVEMHSLTSSSFIICLWGQTFGSRTILFWDFGLDLWPRSRTYGPVPIIILKNILSQICSRTISKKHTASEANIKHAPGAVCILNMVLVHIWLRKFFQVINGIGPYGPGAYGPGPNAISQGPNLQKAFHTLLKLMVFNHLD